MTTKKDFIILRGLPGSGKSTFASEVLGGMVCCADDFMIDEYGEYDFKRERLKECHEKCFEKFKMLVNLQEPKIILSNTNTQNWEFLEYQEFAIENGYRVFHVILENRHDSENIHGCDVQKVQEMRNRFEIKL